MNENLTPDNVNTVYDIENLYKDHPDMTKRYLESLLDGRFQFVKDRKLTTGQPGIEDATHRVDSEYTPDPNDPMDKEKGTTERWQMVLEEDPNAYLFKIGFTSAAQAQALLDSWR